MKKSFKTMSAALMTTLALAVFTFTPTACSNEDDPKAILPGDEMVEWINELLCSKEGNLYTNVAGDDYVLTVNSKEEAHEFCEALIREKWDGHNTTLILPDGCGSISLSDASSRGAYYLVFFRNVKYLDSFSLHVAPPEFLKGENSSVGQLFPPIITFKCNDCKNTFRSVKKPEECPYCGGTSIRSK